MIIYAELREQIARALRGQVSLNDLYAWLMDRSWNMHKDSDPEAVELAAEVEALFFERSDGIISDEKLRHSMLDLVNNAVISIEFDENLQAIIRPSLALRVAPLFASPHPEPVRVFRLQPI